MASSSYVWYSAGERTWRHRIDETALLEIVVSQRKQGLTYHYALLLEPKGTKTAMMSYTPASGELEVSVDPPSDVAFFHSLLRRTPRIESSHLPAWVVKNLDEGISRLRSRAHQPHGVEKLLGLIV